MIDLGRRWAKMRNYRARSSTIARSVRLAGFNTSPSADSIGNFEFTIVPFGISTVFAFRIIEPGAHYVFAYDALLLDAIVRGEASGWNSTIVTENS